MGRDFFVAFPKSSFFEQEVLSIFITTQSNQDVSVLVGSLRGYNISTYVRSGQTRVLHPPNSFEVMSKFEYNKGIRLQVLGSSDQKVSVSVMKHATASTLSGTYLALPPITYQNLNKYEYYVTSYYWTNRVPTNYSSVVVLVGNQVNTSVTITPSQRVEIPPHFLSASFPRSVVNAGDSYPVTIQPMETLHIESLHDLTGTKIVSDKPLTVLGSHECADVPVGVEYCDYLVEQFPPTVTWGRVFLLTSLHSRLTGELYRVIAMKSLTSIRVKCAMENHTSPEPGHAVLLLNVSGESREFALGRDKYCSVVANKPVLLVQYSKGYSLDNVGDPSMLVIPPISQYSNNFVFTSPAHYNSHLTITVSVEHYNNSKILVNGTRIDVWSPVYCSNSAICGYGARLSVPQGTHRVQHVDSEATLMVFAYGFEYHDGYGQIAGTRLTKIAGNGKHILR